MLKGLGNSAGNKSHTIINTYYIILRNYKILREDKDCTSYLLWYMGTALSKWCAGQCFAFKL